VPSSTPPTYVLTSSTPSSMLSSKARPILDGLHMFLPCLLSPPCCPPRPDPSLMHYIFSYLVYSLIHAVLRGQTHPWCTTYFLTSSTLSSMLSSKARPILDALHIFLPRLLSHPCCLLRPDPSLMDYIFSYLVYSLLHAVLRGQTHP
jgi:hypothetical protein